MSIDKINSLIKSLTASVADNEKLSISGLVIKLQRAAASRPQDQTLATMTHVMSKMEDNNKLFISKAEFRDIYQKLYVNGTKFASLFTEELGEIKALAGPKFAQASAPMSDISFKSFADPILLNGLSAAFDSKIKLKRYSPEMGQNAVKVVQSNLDSWNLKSSQLYIEDGNEKFIVVKANYDTPKGLTSVLIPIEILKGRVTQPSVFMGNKGPVDLNHINLKNYITSNAGAKLAVQGSDIVNVLTANIQKNSLNEVELALTKMRGSRENQGAFFGDQVLGLKLDPKNVNLDVAIPKSGQFESFAAKFENPLGQANFTFGVDKVNLGRDVVARSLANFDVKYPQITIASANDKSITYAVAIPGKTAFNVPIHFANNKASLPDTLICNGSEMPFNKVSLSRLFAQNSIDYKAAAVASPSYGLKPSELIQTVTAAMNEQNYAKAEDALNILKNKDSAAYKTAFSIYMNGLSKKASTEPVHQCSLIVKSSSSQHPICGHTNLPLHKVYQDKHGICHPEYRKNMEDNFENIAFMHAKAFG